MPIIPIVVAVATGLGFGGWLGSSTNAAITTPEETQNTNGGLNLTKLAGYAIVGGLVYYFGKKIIK